MKYLLVSGLLSCLIIPAVWISQTGIEKSTVPLPVQLSNIEDHRRMLDLLGIKELRPGADGSDKNAPNYANYDESKATPYPDLPELLITNDGRKVTTPEMWWNVRRPEIVELFDSEVYGRVPENAPAVKWETVETTSGTISGINVVTRRLVRHADNSSYSASGKGGSALYRRNWGERLENIADPYAYHWISGNYMKYSTNPLSSNDLPVDTHMLVALCAPRITFLSGSTPEAGDGWVDTKGTFMAGAAALPVFRLLGAKGMGTTEFPPVGIPLVDGQLAFRQHTDGHTAGSNWGFSIDLCEKYGFRTYNMRKQ